MEGLEDNAFADTAEEEHAAAVAFLEALADQEEEYDDCGRIIPAIVATLRNAAMRIRGGEHLEELG